MQPSAEATAGDSVLASYVAKAAGDAQTVGLLLHGSRAGGRHRHSSDYDLIRVVTNDVYEGRRHRSALVERVALEDGSVADVLYQTTTRIEGYVTQPGWYTATYLGARVVFDRSGEIGSLLERMRSEAGRIAREAVPTAYDDYLNRFVRSLKSARRGDDLGRRLHAAESALALVRALFGLESTWPPYHDELEAALPALEAAQDWPAGYVSMALLRLLTDGDVPFQQELEDRVERLMTSRGIEHEWGSDLEPLKALRVPALAFRRARPDEAGAMRELIIRSMGHVDRPSGYLAEARELMSLSGGDLERDEAWVILADGTVAGFYRLSRTDASAAEIEEFHLEPPMIGIGIGRRMFEHALDRAREMGAGRLEWTTDAHALGFYLRMGGEIAGTEPSGIEGEEPLTAMRVDLTGPSRPT